MIVTALMSAMFLPYRKMKVQPNKVTFLSNRSDRLTGNIKSVFFEMTKLNNVDITVLCKKGGLKANLPNLFKFFKLYATSSVVFVDDYYHFLSYLKKKDDVKLIQLWHACGAFKTFGFSRLGRDSYLRQSSPNHRQYDYVIVSSNEVIPYYAEGFGVSMDKVIALGSPRCDVLEDENYKKRFKKRFYKENPEFKGKKILLFAPTFRGGGMGNCFYPIEKFELPVDEETGLPIYDKAMELMVSVYEGIRNGKILSASVIKEGGAAACVCKMAFGNKFGFTFAQGLDKETLFAAKEASFVVELADENGYDGVVLGKTNDNGVFIIDGDVQTVDELIDAWCGKLEKVFATDSGKKANMPYDVPLYKERSIFVAKNKVAKPKVFIPAFPGTNCEVDSARAFEKAGAKANILVVNNLSSSAINETIDKMVEEIESSQIIMLPGGFSGGDEPEGSGKFIATTFRNPKVKEAVTKLLNNRDGLMLGICNGFQALIKLGLVPYGEIKEINENDPTLTFNTIGRHISSMAYTRVASVKSPWFSSVNAGDVFAVPISHGEGRFVANDDVMKKLIENGQVATQYVNLDGTPVSDMPFNPNGSVCAVEGITSPDGRVLGKMGHVERKGNNLYANVPFEKDMKIFESGVNYFK
mgnify:CR=1 FL=1